MLNWLKTNLYLDFSFTKARTSTFLDEKEKLSELRSSIYHLRKEF